MSQTYVQYLNSELARLDSDKQLSKPTHEVLDSLLTEMYNEGHSGYTVHWATNYFVSGVSKASTKALGLGLPVESFSFKDIYNEVRNKEENDFVANHIERLFGIVDQMKYNDPELDRMLGYFQKAVGKTVLSPLTGEESEWGPLEHNIRQNLRESAVFIDENNVASYLYAFVMSSDGGDSWHTGRHLGGAGSSQTITFPYMPSSTYIYINPITNSHFVPPAILPNVSDVVRHHTGEIWVCMEVTDGVYKLINQSNSEVRNLVATDFAQVGSIYNIEYPIWCVKRLLTPEPLETETETN